MEAKEPVRGLKALLDALGAGRRKIMRFPEMPTLAPIERTAREIEQAFGDLHCDRPPQADLHAALREVRAVWKRDQSLDALTDKPKILRLAGWGIFLQVRESEPALGADPAFVDAYARWLRDRGRARAIGAVLHAFLDAYPRTLPTFELWRRELSRLVHAEERPSIRRWQERVARFGILDDDGAARFADAWCTSELPAERFLEDAGFGYILKGSRFLSDAVLPAVLDWIRQGLERDALPEPRLAAALNRLIDETGRLRADALYEPAAGTLLDPFRSRTPEPVLRDRIREFLLDHLGHPAIQAKGSSNRWRRVPDETRHVLLRWLARDALDDFFRILDETALDRHWRERKAFWLRYFEHGCVTDAWMILGRDAARIATKQLKKDESAYGRFAKSTSVEAGHSVLLMRMHGPFGSAVLAEWSHNGAFRSWRGGNKHAPDLYQARYVGSVLRKNEDFNVRHHGGWQPKIRDWLRDHLDIRLAHEPGNYRGL